MEALRVWPTIDQDVIHECTQRKEREWWEGDKHIAVMAMTEVLCLTWLSIRTKNHTISNSLVWYDRVECYGTWHANAQHMIGNTCKCNVTNELHDYQLPKLINSIL